MDYPKMYVDHDEYNWWVMAPVGDWPRLAAPVASIHPLADNPEQLARLFAASGEMLDALERIASLRDLWEAEHALTGPEAELLALADAAIMAATTATPETK